MKYQVLFSLKEKSKKLKCRLLQFLFVALRVDFQFIAGSSNMRLTQPPSVFQLPPLQRSVSFM